MKKIIISIVAGFATLSLGLAIFYAGQFLVSMFQTQEVEAVELIPKTTVETKQITIKELFHPKPVIKNEEIEETETNTEDENFEFIAEGNYYLVGDDTKRIEDFFEISITTRDYSKSSPKNNYDYVDIPPEGYVETMKKFKFVRINIADKQIAFHNGNKKRNQLRIYWKVY